MLRKQNALPAEVLINTLQPSEINSINYVRPNIGVLSVEQITKFGGGTGPDALTHEAS